MGSQFYFALAILILLIGMAVAIYIQNRARKKWKSEAQETNAVKEKIEENIAQVLDYEKQDALLVKQRDQVITGLVAAKTEEEANEEIKNLLFNLRDAYSAL